MRWKINKLIMGTVLLEVFLNSEDIDSTRLNARGQFCTIEK